jgi:hypothetical protein
MELTLTRPWQIILPDPSNPTAALAAAELQTYLQRVSGSTFPISTTRETDNNPAFQLDWQPGDGEAFTWQASPDQVTLQGDGTRGMLYAVYDFLESLGCCWFAPGAQGEHLPNGGTFQLPDGMQHSHPALQGRCLILGHHAFLKDAHEWVEWAARNRMNTIFFHTTPDAQALGSAPEAQYLRLRAEVIPLARERGMIIEHGGHGLNALLPRRLFRKLPQAFRMVNKRRSPDHNFCPSSAEGLAIIRQNAAAHFRSRPEVDVFHLWADDIPGGGWCQCEQCRCFTPAEQLLLATNAVAEVLSQVNPHPQISFLAYHDTEELPKKVKPQPNVCLLWAPRMRCYAHPADSTGCTLNNPRYGTAFTRMVKVWQNLGGAPARVFEYYLDAILFKSVLPPLPRVMQKDYHFYQQAGVHTVQALMTGNSPWVSPQLNVWLAARLGWNPDQDVAALVSSFSRACLGKDLNQYYHPLEKAFAIALEIDPRQVQLTLDDSALSALRIPPVDMGDPVFAPQEILLSRASLSAAIPLLLREAQAALQAARSPLNLPAWQNEQKSFDLQRAWLEFDRARLNLYTSLAQPNHRVAASRWLDEAQAAFSRVLTWGEANIQDPRHWLNFKITHQGFWLLRLNKIRSDHFLHPLARIRLAGKTIIQLIGDLRRMNHIYEREK